MATSGVVKKKTQKRLAYPAESQAARRFHRRHEQHEKAEDIGPGKKMPAHRVVLAAASPPFKLNVHN